MAANQDQDDHVRKASCSNVDFDPLPLRRVDVNRERNEWGPDKTIRQKFRFIDDSTIFILTRYGSKGGHSLLQM